jgi:hypothetical protein
MICSASSTRANKSSPCNKFRRTNGDHLKCTGKAFGQTYSDDYHRVVDRFHQIERDIFLIPGTHLDLRTNPYETED